MQNKSIPFFKVFLTVQIKIVKNQCKGDISTRKNLRKQNQKRNRFCFVSIDALRCDVTLPCSRLFVFLSFAEFVLFFVCRFLSFVSGVFT